jgi:hypothetical protein
MPEILKIKEVASLYNSKQWLVVYLHPRSGHKHTYYLLAKDELDAYREFKHLWAIGPLT